MSAWTALDDAVAAIRVAAPDAAPRIGVVLGSGLGAVAKAVIDPIDIPYEAIPGFPRPGVSSHAGRLRLGALGGIPVAVLQGRAHAFEGHPLVDVVRPVRALARLGCTAVILSNAAGSLRSEVGPGRLMAINDHINWSGVNPLIGANDDRLGTRFTDMSAAYDPDLRHRLLVAAESEGLPLAEGVYLGIRDRVSRPRPRYGRFGRWGRMRSACRRCRRPSRCAIWMRGWSASPPSPTSPPA